MIDSPWRLLPAAGCGKFKLVRDVEFAVVAADFGNPRDAGSS
jgi:hypothetical protein